MGIDWADFQNDGSLGLAIGNFANEMTALYVTDEPTGFGSPTWPNVYGLGAPTQPPMKFGLVFFDYDLDGRLDLLSANGHLESDIAQVQATETYAQPAQLFWNTGRPPATGSPWSAPDRPVPTCSGRSSAGAAPTPTSTATATSTSSYRQRRPRPPLPERGGRPQPLAPARTQGPDLEPRRRSGPG